MEDVLMILLYTALGLAVFFMAKRTRRLKNEWNEIKAEMKEKEASGRDGGSSE